MEIIIRSGNLNDIPFISRLLKAYLDFSLSPLRRYLTHEIEKCRSEFCNELKKRLEEKTLISFIAEEKESHSFLGFCLVEDVRDSVTGEDEIYVNNIAVEESAMGKRVSNKLLKRVEEYAIERGIPVVTGDITVANRRSMLFAMRYFNYKPEKVVLLKYLE
ncbi:MAG TPA: GNAT family N-acetyltransferase [Candidatus Eremiobacteraeota bacterium]|nr:MAG: hypothetical protein BWY64_01647 [bacterium ADurb.Bin363]HPZ08481.1 GNAT family N-acetyltransferase [Candidatus Eremiobacteraeota bacterium]